MRIISQKFIGSFLIIGLILLMSLSQQATGMIKNTSDDPNTPYISLPVNPYHFTFGARIGDSIILRLTDAYNLTSGQITELGDTMNYTLILHTDLELKFYETIIKANGTILSNNWYNLTKDQISIPYFFTTTNVTLILETFANTSWKLILNSTCIHFHKIAENYTSFSRMYIDYIFDIATGWLLWLRQDIEHHDGTILSKMELTGVIVSSIIPTTSTNPPTTTSPTTTSPIITSPTTSNPDNVSTSNSTIETKSEEQRSEPTINLTYGWSYLSAFIVIGFILLRRKYFYK